jgi:DNA-binding MarR family transcriptional regulator
MTGFYDPGQESWDPLRSIGYLTRRASSLILSRLDEIFANHSITFVQWAVLMLLRDGLVNTASDICKNLGYNSGALTRLLDQLERRGFIERNRCDRNRKIVRLSLTLAGRRTAESLTPMVAKSYNRTLSNFTREESETLVRLLVKLVSDL